MGRDDGRERRFQALYAEHVGAVARYAARRADAADVHDVVSEVFLVAWRRLDDVPDDPLPWLLGTARGTIANRRRSALRRRSLGSRLAADPIWALATRTVEDAPEVDRRLLAAIRDLPDREREAFMLVAWDGLDARRAADAAGCTAATFRMRLHRARRRLRQSVAVFGPDNTTTDVCATAEEPR